MLHLRHVGVIVKFPTCKVLWSRNNCLGETLSFLPNSSEYAGVSEKQPNWDDSCQPKCVLTVIELKCKAYNVILSMHTLNDHKGDTRETKEKKNANGTGKLK